MKSLDYCRTNCNLSFFFFSQSFFFFSDTVIVLSGSHRYPSVHCLLPIKKKRLLDLFFIKYAEAINKYVGELRSDVGGQIWPIIVSAGKQYYPEPMPAHTPAAPVAPDRFQSSAPVLRTCFNFREVLRSKNHDPSRMGTSEPLLY